MTSKCTSAWPALTPKWVSWICRLIPLYSLLSLYPIYHICSVVLAGSRSNMSVSALIIYLMTWKSRSRGAGFPRKSMSPKCVRLQSCTMPTCTIFCLTCVGLMALFQCIRCMAHLSINSLLKIPANTGYARQLLSWGIFVLGGMSFPGKVLWDANLAPHLWEDAGRTAWCQSRSVSNLCSVYHYHVPVFNPFKSLLFQLQCQRNCCQKDFHIEQEYCSFDQRHVLVYGIQNEVSGWKGYTHYKLYFVYIIFYSYYTYTDYMHYCQVRQDLPAMSAGWLSYIHQAYRDNAAPQAAAGPPVGQGTLAESIVLPFATNTNLAWCRMLLTSFFQWMPGWIANSYFVIMSIMNVISEKIVSQDK